MPVDFDVSTTLAEGAVSVVAVSGEADLYTAPELRAALARAIDAGSTGVVVDLSQATFIDSTTLGTLMGAVKRLRPRGGEIAIVCTDPEIRKIFEITLLDRVLPMVDSVAAGESLLRGRSPSRDAPPGDA